MARQTPSEYMREYHNLTVFAKDATGKAVAGTAHVTKYQVSSSGERDSLIHAIETVLGKKAPKPLNTAYDSFIFPFGDVLNPKSFYWQSIRRAFGFKGSPEEMRDVLRLAVRLGRIGTGKDVAGRPAAALTMADYAKKFFSLDCNGFVGNYYGLSPEIKPAGWAVISAGEEAKIHKQVAADDGWNGWVKAAVRTLDYIPLKPRKAASEVRSGDVICVYRAADTKWTHIAVIEHATWLDKDEVNYRVVEWGSGTDEKNFDTAKDKHIKTFKTKKLIQGPNKALGVGHLNDEGTKFSYFFAPPNSPYSPARIGRCGQTEI